jgi:hypothetical protein
VLRYFGYRAFLLAVTALYIAKYQYTTNTCPYDVLSSLYIWIIIIVIVIILLLTLSSISFSHFKLFLRNHLVHVVHNILYDFRFIQKFNIAPNCRSLSKLNILYCLNKIFFSHSFVTSHWLQLPCQKTKIICKKWATCFDWLKLEKKSS